MIPGLGIGKIRSGGVKGANETLGVVFFTDSMPFA